MRSDRRPLSRGILQNHIHLAVGYVSTTMPRPAPALVTVLLLSLGLCSASCLGPEIVATAGLSATQAGVAEYKKGTLRTAWDAPLDAMFDASKRALTELGFQITGEVSTGEERSLRAMELDYTAIDILLERVSPVVTILSIRVGTWGDQPVSKLISERIDRHVRAWMNRTRAPGESENPAGT